MNKNNSNVPVPSIISENTNVKGDLISDGIIHVDGCIEGDISCEDW